MLRKTLLGASLFVTAAGLAGCGNDVAPSPDVSGVAGSGGNTALCSTSNTGMSTSIGGLGSTFTPQVGPTVTLPKAPPAISGGTLRLLAGGATAVAADPDRDQVYIVDLVGRTVTATVALQPGDEPGRLAVDAAGRVHVALRGGGALVTIDPAAGAVSDRRDVCSAPRGLAYDPATDLVHVACAGGELVSLPAAGGPATRSLQLDHDLRDVVVEGDQLRVSRFRSAQILTVDASGAVSGRLPVPTFRSTLTRGGQLFAPALAWKMTEIPDGSGVVMVHQRGVNDEILPAPGGYGGAGICDGIIQTAVTTVAPDGTVRTGPAMMGLVVPVDIAVSADSRYVAIVAAGNATNAEGPGIPPRLPRLFVTEMDAATEPGVGCMPDGTHGPCMPLEGGGIPIPAPADTGTGSAGASGGAAGGPGGGGGTSDTGGGGAGGSDTPPPPPPPPPVPTTCDGMAVGTPPSVVGVPSVVGQPIAVAFDPAGNVIVQSREPAMLELPGGINIALSTETRLDTGHALFHANSGGNIACASCHAEGNDDGRVWTFACQGQRRTQSVQVGLAGTEPFHWDGSEHDFPTLVHDVFTGRMSGPALAPDQVTATLHWLDAQPRIHDPAPKDMAAVARGQAIFSDTTRGACVSCHNGEHLTNNMTVDVGTNGMFQVPSLIGVGMRGPYLHTGCAPTLFDRFGPCGGDRHGMTANLSASDISDLVAYLQTL